MMTVLKYFHPFKMAAASVHANTGIEGLKVWRVGACK